MPNLQLVNKQVKNIRALVIIFAMMIIPISPNRSMANNNIDIESVYHLYSNDQHIGIFHNKERAEQLLENILKEQQKSFPNIEIFFEDIKWIEERIFPLKNHEHQIDENSLKEKINVVANVTAIMIEDEVIGYISDDFNMEDLFHEIINPYLKQDEIIQTADKEEKNYAEMSVGESFISDITLSPDFKPISTTVSPEKIMSFDELKEEIFIEENKKNTYLINEGDVLGSIATEFNMTVNDLLALNPSVNIDTVLKIGSELTIEEAEQLIDVSITRIQKEIETIEYETIYEEDENLWKGESYVKQEGKDGAKEVLYEVSSTNNKMKGKEIIEEVTLEEKTDEIIIKGTKVAPSRGTGNFIWPTNGGRVSSYQGMRWGRYHKGIDIARPSDYSILAADNGTVTFSGWKNGYGNTIEINHNNGFKTQYAHLQSMDIAVGDIVSQGGKIGTMGTTGRSTGIHLDFEVYYNGDLINPIDVLP